MFFYRKIKGLIIYAFIFLFYVKMKSLYLMKVFFFLFQQIIKDYIQEVEERLQQKNHLRAMNISASGKFVIYSCL